MSETPIHTSTTEWSQDLTEEDRIAISRTPYHIVFIVDIFQRVSINLIFCNIYFVLELSAKAPHAIIMEIKKIHDEAYQLGVREAKEMTRGKYLGIFNNYKKKT